MSLERTKPAALCAEGSKSTQTVSLAALERDLFASLTDPKLAAAWQAYVAPGSASETAIADATRGLTRIAATPETEGTTAIIEKHGSRWPAGRKPMARAKRRG